MAGLEAPHMSKLAQIEDAVGKLTEEERAELLLRLGGSLHVRGAMREPRIFSEEQIDAWVEEDERAMQELRKEWGI
jgi:hypothetical protein